jgi:hypothetical protein
MQKPNLLCPNQKILSVLALLVTLAVLRSVDRSLFAAAVLLPLWFIIYRPWSRVEIASFTIATVFMLIQDYSMGKSGGSSFKQQDVLLMPWYEPFLWGFYYINMKRFIGEGDNTPVLDKRSLFGLLVTALVFPLFSRSSGLLLLTTIGSTAILFIMFHDLLDLYFAAYALGLGFVVELFGVSSGLWSYPPQPDFMGIPYWCATMWLSAGILGRRFLFPLAGWIDGMLMHAKPAPETSNPGTDHGSAMERRKE